MANNQAEIEADKIIAIAMMNLIETASKDGVITQEESKMIESIEFSLRFYKKLLVDALEDGVVTSEEKESLEKMKDGLIDDAYKVAEEIDGISKDEMNLLISLMLKIVVPKK